jgi:hypothetical protein
MNIALKTTMTASNIYQIIISIILVLMLDRKTYHSLPKMHDTEVPPKETDTT